MCYIATHGFTSGWGRSVKSSNTVKSTEWWPRAKRLIEYLTFSGSRNYLSLRWLVSSSRAVRNFFPEASYTVGSYLWWKAEGRRCEKFASRIESGQGKGRNENKLMDIKSIMWVIVCPHIHTLVAYSSKNKIK